MSHQLRRRGVFAVDYRAGSTYSETVDLRYGRRFGKPQPKSPRPFAKRFLYRAKRLFVDCVFSPLLLVATISILAFLPSRYFREGILRSALQDLSDLGKRLLDIIGGLIGLALTSPFFLMIPLIIKLDSPGPVFYVQKRVGRDRRNSDRRRSHLDISFERRNGDRRRFNYYGMLFDMYKFRTMRADAEKKSGPIWATRNDPRITRCGRILRLTRLDEIPQFLNVLKGEMSLVGPRPERPEFVRDLAKRLPDYTRRLRVKPGITGIAQVETGYDSSVDDVRTKLRYDIEYINNGNLWMDFRIMVRTFWVVLTGKGAV